MMNDTELNLGLWIGGLYGLRKAFQAIDTGNEDILYTAVLKLSQYAEPELGAFGLAQLQPQQLHLSVKIHAQSRRRCVGSQNRWGDSFS